LVPGARILREMESVGVGEENDVEEDVEKENEGSILRVARPIRKEREGGSSPRGRPSL